MDNMAKAKILHDRISIKSEILTDENLDKVKVLCPSALVLRDEKDETILYGVDKSDSLPTFNNNGACFKNSVTIGTINDSIMNLPAEEKANKIKTLLTAALTRINAIEEQVSEYIDNAEDLSDDIEFLDFEEETETVTTKDTKEEGGKR